MYLRRRRGRFLMEQVSPYPTTQGETRNAAATTWRAKQDEKRAPFNATALMCVCVCAAFSQNYIFKSQTFRCEKCGDLK